MSRTQYLLRSTAGAFGTLAAGYALMTAAPGLATLLPAVIVRSLGAATLWVYSTLLLQYRVENRIQGECSPGCNPIAIPNPTPYPSRCARRARPPCRSTPRSCAAPGRD